MSIRLMSLVFGMEKPVGAARLVLLALADNANDEGVCWPSHATIARKAGLDERRTRRMINALVKDGYLSLSVRPVPGMRNDTNIYTLNIEALIAGQAQLEGAETLQRGANKPSSGGQIDPPEGGIETPQRGAPEPSESSLEPSSQPSSQPVVVVNAPDAQKIGKIAKLYEREIGPLTAFIRDELEEEAKTCPEEWFEIAFRAAAAQNRRSWAYVRAVIKNIREHGVGGTKPKTAQAQSPGRRPSLKEQNDAVVEMILNGGVK